MKGALSFLFVLCWWVPSALAQERTDEEAQAESPPAGESALPTISAVESPPVDEQGLRPNAPAPPIYETWWFWTAIAAAVIGITLAIVVDVTTDDPAPSSRAPPMGLTLRF